MQGFSRTLDALPCVFEGNPLNLLFLDNIHVVKNAEHYRRQLAAPTLLSEQREVLLSASQMSVSQRDYPTFRYPDRPDPEHVSEMLFERFYEVEDFILSQNNLAAYLAREVQSYQPDVVILVVADGLSYYDLPDSPDVQPCFVKGPTITPHGYRASLGKPPLAQHLFMLGYRNQAAFTYFDISSNELARTLHEMFSDTQVHRVREFGDILKHPFVRQRPVESYIQITRAGLDSLCHQHRERPPVEVYRQRLLEDFEALVDQCSRQRRVLACLTADHGILWHDSVSDFVKIDAPTASFATHPRYLKGGLLRDYAVTVKTDAGTFSLLKSPYLSRAMRSNEWGVHGGVSAWESLVPLKMVKT